MGATDARIFVADYGLTSLQELGDYGPTGVRFALEGTSPGLCFARGKTVVSREDGKVWLALCEGSERMGVLELAHPHWSDDHAVRSEGVLEILVLVLVSKRRYTDVVLRSRRAEPLSLAAEMQWDLLPPLTLGTDRVSVSGILEPAYSIGGDSFHYAINPGRLEFAITDAVGHGMSAVLMSVTAINSLRNARREGASLEMAFRSADEIIEQQFGEANFVTAQIGALELATGELTWVNAGHPLPLLVRDGTYVGPLVCRPSLPLGLGGRLHEVGSDRLQPGDRVLFYTDGVVETRDADGQQFGIDRLADFLVRATLDGVEPAETVRRLSASILDYNGADLSDDATLLLLEYHGTA
jgi:serine phosphatase RsbU (regulator of sigma subunit)